jgi:hypothetical protein
MSVLPGDRPGNANDSVAQFGRDVVDGRARDATVPVGHLHHGVRAACRAYIAG